MVNKMAFKILIVEDEKNIQEILKSYLLNDGYSVISATDGFEAIGLFNDEKPDLLILDRMLPGVSGEQVCLEVRKLSDVPILMLTAKTSEESKIEGFGIGVDDYVTKPFSPREVMVRIKALLKRSYPEVNKNKLYDDGYLRVDLSVKEVWIKDTEVRLTANEMTLLETLILNKPQPLSRGQLVDKAFGYDYDAFERNIDTYIKNIRHKIEADTKKPQYICTKYGLGYYFGG